MTIHYHENTTGFRLQYFAKEYADRTAVTSYDDYRRHRCTYSEILAHSVRTARMLLHQGCRKGDAVMVCAPNSVEYVALIFASSLLGLKLVPVDVSTAKESVEKFCAATAPKMLFSGRPDLDDIGDGRITTLSMATLFEETATFSPSLDELLEDDTYGSWYIDESDVFITIFTSGTTSAPKSVPLTHRNLIANVANFRHHCFIPEQHHLLSMAPLSHALGLTMGLMCALSFGAQVVYVEQLTSSNIMRVFRRDHIDAVLTVPAFLNILKERIEAKMAEQGKLEAFQRAIPKLLRLPMWIRRFIFRKLHRELGGNLKWIATGASALNVQVGNFWEAIGVKVVQGYGLTECLIVSVADFDWRRMGTVGKCLPGQEIRLDENNEIWLAGPNVFNGYADCEEAERVNETVFQNGWYRTGDVGKLDADGHLSIVGRLKNVIIGPSGLNIYPEDIENVVSGHEAVQECVVLNMPKAADELYLVAFVTLSDQTPKETTSTALLDKANGQLSSHQKLAKLVVWPEDDFPRTPSGKIQRRAVVTAFDHMCDLDQINKNARVPQTEYPLVVRLIARHRRMDVSEISMSSRLISNLGFDSLGLMELVTQLEERLGTALRQDELFNRDLTVNEFLALAEQSGVSTEPKASLQENWIERVMLAFSRAFSRGIMRSLLQGMFRLEVEEPSVMKKQVALGMKRRGVIFIANHASHLDGLCIQSALPLSLRKRLVAAAAEDHFWNPDNRLRHYALSSQMRAFPVKRTGNPKEYFIRMGEILDRNESVLIFPEGTRSRTGKLGEFPPSIGQLVAKLDAPVVPVFLHGTFDAWPAHHKRPTFTKIKLRFHEPMMFSKKQSARDIRDELFALYKKEFSMEGGK